MPRPTKCGNGSAGGPGVPPLRKSRAIPGGHPHPLPSGAPVPTPFGLRPFPPDRGNRPPGRGGGLRAAQVCRPYERTGQFSVVTLIRPLRGHLPPERGKACGRPHGAAPTKGPGNSRWSPSSAPFGGTFSLEGGRLSGDRKGRPYGVFCTRNVCSAKSGAGVEPQQL